MSIHERYSRGTGFSVARRRGSGGRPGHSRRRFVIAAGLAAGLLVTANIGLYIWYSRHTYPNTTVAGYHTGSLTRGQLAAVLPAMVSLPANLQLTIGANQLTVAVKGLGIEPDYPTTVNAALVKHSWLPLAGLWQKHTLPLQLRVDRTKLQAAIQQAISSLPQTPHDAKIIITGNAFAIQPDVAGQHLDATTSSQQLIAGLQAGQTHIRLYGQTIAASVTAASLQAILAGLQAQIHTTLTIHFGSQSKQFGAGDIIQWFVPDQPSYILSADAVKRTVGIAGASYGITVGNLDQVAGNVSLALSSHKLSSLEATAAQPGKTMTYCTAVRGVDSSNLSVLNTRLLTAYADPRGWSLGGPVGFKRVDSNCDFTVWLAAGDQMAGFGAICDSQWSCTVPPNVVINFDRWQGATDSWNAAHAGSLDEYRAMAVNHETGHELGFGHTGCPAAGSAAPVMEQQSINLQGCMFNAWPLPSEQAVERTRLGL